MAELVKTSKAAIEDLGRYGGALDKFVLRANSTKLLRLT